MDTRLPHGSDSAEVSAPATTPSSDRLMAAPTLVPGLPGGADAGVSVPLPLPPSVELNRLHWPYTITVVSLHLLALLALLPWYFSWTGVIVCGLGVYAYGLLGINLGYHRLLTHRGFRCPKWVEHTLAVLGVLSIQDTPARWVAVHRRHHEHSDDEQDPHSPLVNFFWAHFGWLLVENRELDRLGILARYAKDLRRDPFYVWLERNNNYYKLILLSWAAYFVAAFAAALAMGDSPMEAAQFGASVWLWGVVVRTVIVWHQTWSVNSVTHLWGYRNYETDEKSRNNWVVGFTSSGEGWHNNHHADPRSARHGHCWWEVDTTYLTLRGLAAIGLASDIAQPSPRLTTALQTRLQTHEFEENRYGRS